MTSQKQELTVISDKSSDDVSREIQKQSIIDTSNQEIQENQEIDLILNLERRAANILEGNPHIAP